MNLKMITRVGSLMVIFFFLPSLLMKIWQALVKAPWPVKSWLVYLALGAGLVLLARRRLRKGLQKKNAETKSDLIQIAKERLVKGEISVTEFKEIRQELGE